MTTTVCQCAKLRRAAHQVTRHYDRALAGSGLKITQYSLLVNAARLEGPTLVKLATTMCLDRSTLGRNARVLARQGLVTLGGGADERTTVVEVTLAGRTALARAEPMWRAAQATLERAMGPDVSAIAAILARLDTLDRAESAQPSPRSNRRRSP